MDEGKNHTSIEAASQSQETFSKVEEKRLRRKYDFCLLAPLAMM